MKDKPIAYEPHPVSPERKAELIAQGFRILDAAYQPADEQPAEPKTEPKPEPKARRTKDKA